MINNLPKNKTKLQ